MKQSPFFTILLPAKSRPRLVRDALISVLNQSFTDFEVIVSNNGANSEVRCAIEELITDKRVQYIEQPEVLSMPVHWERISRQATGRYITVLTDRSVLKKGALKTIADVHQSNHENSDIVTWDFDIFDDEANLFGLSPFQTNLISLLDSAGVLLETMHFTSPCTYHSKIPRGLNSSVSMRLINKIRLQRKDIFVSLSPDYTFAFACLMTCNKLIHISCSLMISQGGRYSNGGTAYSSEASSYLRSLKLINPIVFSKIKTPFVENLLAEDFLAACHTFGRSDLQEQYGMENVYLKCLTELEHKKERNILPIQRLHKLEHSLKAALILEPKYVQDEVYKQWQRRNSWTLVTHWKTIRHSSALAVAAA
jgi:hypothetical protein